LARERLRTLLKEEPDVRIVEECSTGEETLAALAGGRADLVFLDIKMPGLTGFEVLHYLPKERLPLVVVVTAFDEHAVSAFEVPALHYLLKPYKQSALREAVARARVALAQRRTAGESASQPARLQRISIRVGNRLVFVRTDQIDWIESAGNYVVLHCGKDNHVLRQTIKALEDSLAADRFLRVSRSALVNRDRVKEVQPSPSGEHRILLLDGTQIAMTRGLREVEQSLKFA
jgi:two-component system LytT family response regulator